MNTQKIKRSNLQKLHSISCDGWKNKIAELALFQSGDQIEVENNIILEAHGVANKEQKKEIEKYFKVISDKIEDRIKSWKDVVKEYESKYNEKVALPTNGKSKQERSINAFYQIQIISRVLNEDDKFPDFTNSSQHKYYPYFERKSLGWVLGSNGFSRYYDWSVIGFGCLYKTSEKAIYAGTTFLDIYKDYLPE
jgi:hypothetical protein